MPKESDLKDQTLVSVFVSDFKCLRVAGPQPLRVWAESVNHITKGPCSFRHNLSSCKAGVDAWSIRAGNHKQRVPDSSLVISTGLRCSERSYANTSGPFIDIASGGYKCSRAGARPASYLSVR